MPTQRAPGSSERMNAVPQHEKKVHTAMAGKHDDMNEM